MRSPKQTKQLISLNAKYPKWSFKQIAECMNEKPQTVRHWARQLGLQTLYIKGQRNCIHKHLAKKVFIYFLTHSAKDTQKHFSLTESQFKSIFTSGYRRKDLAHLRKDTRRKDAWSLDEMLFAIKASGIKRRVWIAKSLSRGSALCIKDKFHSWNAKTKHLNGLPITWAKQLWPRANLASAIKTEAGPGNAWYFCIIPWHDCVTISENNETPTAIKSGLRALSKFHEFIYQTKNPCVIRTHINAILKE